MNELDNALCQLSQTMSAIEITTRLAALCQLLAEKGVISFDELEKTIEFVKEDPSIKGPREYTLKQIEEINNIKEDKSVDGILRRLFANAGNQTEGSDGK